jgi:DNA polymerase III subunit gamma/tau
MSYRVLARAYRSNTFGEVVGQEPIATTLSNAIKSGRIHHGYLFTGTRGVGKTSLARILAKALNCLSSEVPTPEPCCTCESCLAIARGDDVDVVEIDAASHTGVDNIRELRGNATLRPARSRFKVYIIDEVHMLSTGAFNALLKTLEEPPPHVKFILATTESQKVPATIQSRCQRFDFRAIGASSIAKHLGEIATKENIKVDEAVLRRVARLANGSMRDALSLLDMLLSYESKHLTAKIVDTILPPPHDELASDVIEAIAAGDAAQTLAALDTALQSGRTVDRFCDHLIEHVRTLMLMRTCGTETELVDVSASMRPALAKQAARFDPPTCVYMIALLEELRRNVKFSGGARALADAAMVRLAMSGQFTDIAELLKQISRGGPADSIRKGSATPATDKKKTSVARAR